MQRKHRYDADTDRCACGGVIIYGFGREMCEVLEERILKANAYCRTPADRKAAAVQVNAEWPRPKRTRRQPAFVLYD